MHVLFQMKVPVEIAQRLQAKLESLRKSFDRDRKTLEKRIATTTNPDLATDLTESYQSFLSIASRLNIHNLVRLALEEGIGAVEEYSSDEIFSMLVAKGIAKGRPKNESAAR